MLTSCPRCDYSLQGVEADRCPECGLDLAAGEHTRLGAPFVLRFRSKRQSTWSALWFLWRHPIAAMGPNATLTRPVMSPGWQLWMWAFLSQVLVLAGQLVIFLLLSLLLNLKPANLIDLGVAADFSVYLGYRCAVWILFGFALATCLLKFGAKKCRPADVLNLGALFFALSVAPECLRSALEYVPWIGINFPRLHPLLWQLGLMTHFCGFAAFAVICVCSVWHQVARRDVVVIGIATIMTLGAAVFSPYVFDQIQPHLVRAARLILP